MANLFSFVVALVLVLVLMVLWLVVWVFGTVCRLFYHFTD